MSHSTVENYLHVIFAAKNRDALIPSEIENRLHSYLAGIAKKRKVPILRINGTDDHIHILLKLHPAISLSTLIKELKAYSTGWLKKEGFKEFCWQEGYGGFSCSKTHLEPLSKYIDNQKAHHRKYTFRDEINRLNLQWGTSWMNE